MNEDDLEGFKAALIVVKIGLGFLIGCRIIEIINNILK